MNDKNKLIEIINGFIGTGSEWAADVTMGAKEIGPQGDWKVTVPDGTLTVIIKVDKRNRASQKSCKTNRPQEVI